jgi:hypothetical protein
MVYKGIYLCASLHLKLVPLKKKHHGLACLPVPITSETTVIKTVLKKVFNMAASVAAEEL